MTLALEAEGDEITTVEGLMEGEELGPVQQARPLEQNAYKIPLLRGLIEEQLLAITRA